MSESERPQRLVEMRLAVSAFYAGPTDDTHKAAHDAMLNYRRTFRGIDTKSLQALSEKIECVDGGIDGGECLLLRKRKNAEHEMLVGVIINKYHSLSIASLEYHANVALDLAMELKLHGDIPLAWINEDRRLMKGEKELAEL
ncbi:MAG: hypothetical protein HY053_04905, partial [Proteobacteria bacterium]|nr:hypothetical protein [Pseudomonadota bacterium]